METLDNRQFWRTIHRFNSSYYSGLDVRLFIGDRWLDVASALEFNVQEMVVPIYGYKSYSFDTVLHGIRTIQGSLAMHFVRPMYLFELMSSIDEPIVEVTGTVDGGGGGGEATASGGGTDALQSVEMDDRTKYIQLYMNRGSLISRYWGEEEEPEPIYPDATHEAVPIFITSVPVSLVIVYSDPVGRESEAKRFGVNVAGVVGPSSIQNPGQLVVGRHIEVLDEVTFTGVSRAMDDTGHSLMEVYSFIARTWNDAASLEYYRDLILNI